MADVRAFPAIRYDPARAGALEDLVAPPYDVIPEADLELYRARSPHNVVRLIRPGADYAGAARLLEEWKREGVLRRDGPSMYLHEVEFEGRRRRDLVAALRVQPYEDRAVLPHERTHRGPKEDRLALFRATGHSLEPLWFTYDGERAGLREELGRRFAADPTTVFEFPGGERHRLWAVADPAFSALVHDALADEPVLIADGHHRYETTLAYTAELGGGPDAAARFTLAILTDLDDPGLVVLPTHRLLRSGVAVTGGEPASGLEDMLARIEGRQAAGTYRAGEFQVLELEGDVPVVELHAQVIDNILGRRSAEESLYYTRDPREAVAEVDAGRAVAAFFLGTPDLRVVLEKAREGMVMPQKTTFFHPKPPSGMLFHQLDPGTDL